MRWLLLALALLASPAWADSLPLLGVGSGGGGGGGGYTGPGDIVSSWSFWGGLRAFSAATVSTKAANVCNSGDANCADVSTLANGNFDVTTAQGAPLNCGGTGGTCTVKTLYDKSGNAKDATQATISARPTLSFNCVNTSLPCMVFASANSQKLLTSAVVVNAPQSVSAVVNETANGGFNAPVIGDPGGAGMIEFHGDAVPATICDGSTNTTGSATDNAWHALQGVCASGTGNTIINVDGSSTTGTQIPTNINNPLQIGPSNTASMKITEAGMWPGAFTSGNLSSLHSNQSTYYGTP